MQEQMSAIYIQGEDEGRIDLSRSAKYGWERALLADHLLPGLYINICYIIT